MFSRVSAHVLITDDTNSKGAILHIIPDDDPVAGEISTIFFDMQNSGINDVLLRIDGNPVTTRFDGSLATAEYIFPTQAEYEMRFTVRANEATYVFTHNQRVTRGVSASPLDQADHIWAEITLLTSALGLVLLFIVAINRRSEIKLQSKW